MTAAQLAASVSPVFAVQPNIIDYRMYATAVGGFIQDNYKMLPGLMLEYGVRFEWNGTPVEGENRMSMFQPVGSTTSTLIQVGTNGIPREPYKQNYNLEPRVGLAYDVFNNQKTVLRAAYGYLVDQPVAGTSTILTGNPPFTTAVSYSNSAAPQPLSSIYNSATAASGFALGYVNPNYHNGYIESFNFNIQQALPWSLIGSIGYYGSTGHHLLDSTNLNQASGPPGQSASVQHAGAEQPDCSGSIDCFEHEHSQQHRLLELQRTLGDSGQDVPQRHAVQRELRVGKVDGHQLARFARGTYNKRELPGLQQPGRELRFVGL